MQGRTGRRTGGASGIPLDARIKDDTPEMLKNLWKTRITRGGWFPTSTIDPHRDPRRDSKIVLSGYSDALIFLSGAVNIALSVCYTLRIDRVTRRASSRDLSCRKIKRHRPYYLIPCRVSRTRVDPFLGWKMIIHPFTNSFRVFFFSFFSFFFCKLKSLERRRSREKAWRSREKKTRTYAIRGVS